MTQQQAAVLSAICGVTLAPSMAWTTVLTSSCCTLALLMGLFGCGAQSWLSTWWPTGMCPSTQSLAGAVYAHVCVYVHVYVHSQDYTPDLADCQPSYRLSVERKQAFLESPAGIWRLKLCASLS